MQNTMFVEKVLNLNNKFSLAFFFMLIILLPFILTVFELPKTYCNFCKKYSSDESYYMKRKGKERK